MQAAGVSGRDGQGGGEASLGSIGVNVVTYSSAMAACRNGGKWEKALLLMEVKFGGPRHSFFPFEY